MQDTLLNVLVKIFVNYLVKNLALISRKVNYKYSVICSVIYNYYVTNNNLGGKVKKHSRNEFNFEATTARVQNLSYFDQHVVTWQCSLNVLEAINAFATGNCIWFLITVVYIFC